MYRDNCLKINHYELSVFLRDNGEKLNISIDQCYMLINLATRNGNNTNFVVTQEFIIKDSRLSERHARRLLSDLVKRNLVLVSKYGKFNNYHVNPKYKQVLLPQLSKEDKKISSIEAAQYIDTGHLEQVGGHLTGHPCPVKIEDTIYNKNNNINNNNPPIIPLQKPIGDNLLPVQKIDCKLHSTNNISNLIHSDEIIKIVAAGEGTDMYYNFSEYDKLMQESSKKHGEKNTSNSMSYLPYRSHDKNLLKRGDLDAYPFLLEFLNTFPKLTSVAKAIRYWKQHGLEKIGAIIVADVKNRISYHHPWIENIKNGTRQYLPNAYDYLFNKTWEFDEILFIKPIGDNNGNRSVRSGFRSIQAEGIREHLRLYNHSLPEAEYLEKHGLKKGEKLPVV